MVKTITIKKEVYRKLPAIKSNESFSDPLPTPIGAGPSSGGALTGVNQALAMLLMTTPKAKCAFFQGGACPGADPRQRRTEMTNSPSVNNPVEGVNAKRGRGRPRKTVGRRRSKPLGRYPFVTVIGRYLEGRKGIVARSTYKEEERKLRYLAKVLQDLKTKGEINSSNPEKMGRKDIQGLMGWMRDRELDPETQAKYLQHLNSLLLFCGNPAVENLKREGVRLPSGRGKRIRSIGEDDLATIRAASEKIEGWNGEMARFMVWILPATGLRPKELRLAHLEDFDLRRRTFYVRHPKGEGSWASPETVELIRMDVLRLIKRYLVERDDHIRSKGLRKATALFPNLYRGQDEFYSANGFFSIKQKVEEISGVEFKLKDFRSTLTSITVRGDIGRLPAMSAQLRHNKMETTQKYYASIERSAASRQLRDIWKENPVIVRKNSVIESDFDNTGYV